MVVKDGMRLAQGLVGWLGKGNGTLGAKACFPSPVGPQHWAQLAMVPCLSELPCSSLGTHVEHLCPVGTPTATGFVTALSLLP